MPSNYSQDLTLFFLLWLVISQRNYPLSIFIGHKFDIDTLRTLAT